MAEITQQVVQALTVLYHGTDPTHKAGADRFLREFHKHEIAWTFSQQLLSSHPDPAFQFFGALTLLEKIRSSWSSLSQEAKSSLRQGIFQLIPSKLQQKAVFSKSAQLLAAIIVYGLLEDLPNGLEVLFGLCSSQDFANRFIGLEILSFIPEEQNHPGASCGDSRKIKSILRNQSASVLSLCVSLFESKDETIQLQTIKCLKSWLEFGISMSDLVKSGAMNLFFQMLQVPALVQIAADFLQYAFENDVPPELYGVFSEFFNKLNGLSQIYVKAKADESNEVCGSISLLIRELFESHIRVLFVPGLLGDGSSSPSISILLPFVNEILTHTETNISINAFDIIIKIENHITSLPQQEQMQTKASLEPFFTQIAQAVSLRTQMPINEDLSQDAEFLTYRAVSCDAMISCSRIIGNHLIQLLIILAQPSNPWNQIESALYHIHALAEVTTHSSAELASIFQLISSLPRQILIQRNILLIIESTYEILQNTEFARPSMEYIINCFQNPSLWEDAGNAFVLLCQTAGSHFAPNINLIKENVLHVIIQGQADAKFFTESQAFKRASRKVAGGISSKCTEGMLILAGYAPIETKVAIYQEFMSLFVQKMQNASSQRGQPGSKEEEIKWMCLLAVMLRCMNNSADVVNATQQNIAMIWTALKQCPEVISVNEGLTQSICQFVKHLCQLFASSAVVVDALQFVSTLYLPIHQQQCIDTVAYGLKFLERTPEFLVQGCRVVQGLIDVVWGHVSGAPASHPDLLGSLLELCHSAIVNLGQAFPENVNCTAVMEISLRTVLFADPKTTRSALKCIITFVQSKSQSPQYEAVMNQIGTQFVYLILRGVAGECHSHSVARLGEILFLTARIYPESFPTWGIQCFEIPGVPPLPFDQQTKTFIFQGIHTLPLPRYKAVISDIWKISRGEEESDVMLSYVL